MPMYLCRLQLITLIDHRGRPHSVNIRVCDCVPTSEHMAFTGLWPSHPVHCDYAFHSDFLETMRIMTLENQVSTRGFIEAYRHLNDLNKSEAAKMYSVLWRTVSGR